MKRIIITLLLLASAALAQSAETGTLIFYRPNKTYKPSAFCDGIRLARLSGFTYLEVTAAAGQHVCTVERLNKTKAAVTVEVTPGSRTYLRMTQGFSGWHVKVVPAEEARREVGGLAPLDKQWVFQTTLPENTRLTR
jgi:hypothetical protein